MTNEPDVLIDVGPPDTKSRRIVAAIYRGVEHRDEFNINIAKPRARFINAAAAELGLDTAELQHLHGKILAAADDRDMRAETAGEAAANDNGKKSQATRLVELAADDELFHDPDGNAYASLLVGECRQTWPVRFRQYRDNLRRRFFEQTQAVPSSQAIQDALGVLEARAGFQGQECVVALRVAEQDGSIYLDLANDRWEAVEITADGWRVVCDPPVRFRRTRAMLALPQPVVGGNINQLRQFINLADDHANQWPLIVGWLVMAFRPKGPYPVLCLYGEQGSAKSTAAKVLRGLIDPNTASLRADPREPRDLVIAANNSWIICLDNLSHIRPWLSDALCRLSTGGGFSTRELYTDSDEFVFSGQRPCIVNGITEMVTRGDLMDRALIITLPAIPEDKRRPESELLAQFEQARPRLLGALLDALVVALRNLPRTKLPRLPRMADFALWSTAAEPAFGWPAGTFMRAYSENRSSANESVLEACPVAIAVREFARNHRGDWQGSASELLTELDRLADERTKRQTDWPKGGRALSNALRRQAPNLRRSGVEITFGRTGRKRFVNIGSSESCVTSVTGVTNGENGSPAVACDGGAGDAWSDAACDGDGGEGGVSSPPRLPHAGHRQDPAMSE